MANREKEVWQITGTKIDQVYQPWQPFQLKNSKTTFSHIHFTIRYLQFFFSTIGNWSTKYTLAQLSTFSYAKVRWAWAVLGFIMSAFHTWTWCPISWLSNLRVWWRSNKKAWSSCKVKSTTDTITAEAAREHQRTMTCKICKIMVWDSLLL